jgi:hypothetical protein
VIAIAQWHATALWFRSRVSVTDSLRPSRSIELSSPLPRCFRVNLPSCEGFRDQRAFESLSGDHGSVTVTRDLIIVNEFVKKKFELR